MVCLNDLFKRSVVMVTSGQIYTVNSNNQNGKWSFHSLHVGKLNGGGKAIELLEGRDHLDHTRSFSYWVGIPISLVIFFTRIFLLIKNSISHI